ncbi:MAG: carboxylesterase family protein, partial [Ruminococcaceae bacterium]|nr:carboxylesterase family protein [Oscillospiraceae bacterium]
MIRKVKIENGWVKGLPAANPCITSYKGIPFAAPPVGENRWRAPQPCPDWEGEYPAYDFGPIAYQPITGYDKENIYTREWAMDVELPMGEDCLYLNVWAPAQGQKDMPVYVWYFGGGLQVGHTAEMEFDGERLARRGIVVVTVGYRLNVFGFFGHPELTAESGGATTNFGFLDQQFATQWVKRNIAAFGGDPNNITIGGQSAGGMSVSAQLCDKANNEGLFNRAIIQSGVFAPAYPMALHGLEATIPEVEQRGVEFFKYLGVETLAEARALEGDYVYRKMLDWEDRRPWCAAVDERFVKSAGQWFTHNDRLLCPLFMGCTDNEFIITPDAEDDASLADFADKLPGLDKERFLSLFPYPADRKVIEENGKINAVEFAVRAAARRKEIIGDDSPVYFYSFETDIPGWDNPGC